MIQNRVLGICTGTVLACCTSSLLADLSQHEFVEAIGLLGLNPDTLAAAGVSEADLITTYQAISESDDRWAAVTCERNALRSELDAIANDQDGDGMDAVESARTLLAQAISSWRDSVTGSMPQSARDKVNLVVMQSETGLPAYLLVQPWSPEELLMLSKGMAHHQRQMRDGSTEGSVALDFYLDALGVGDVILAKANWDARRAVYTQRFTERLVTLD